MRQNQKTVNKAVVNITTAETISKLIDYSNDRKCIRNDFDHGFIMPSSFSCKGDKHSGPSFSKVKICCFSCDSELNIFEFWT